MAAARKTQVLADRLADDLAAGIEDARHDRRILVGDITFQHVGAIHHRDAGETNIVLDGDPLAAQLARRRSLNGALPIPGVEAILLSCWAVSCITRVLHR